LKYLEIFEYLPVDIWNSYDEKSSEVYEFGFWVLEYLMTVSLAEYGH
jgi:hypothetical protein